MIECPQKNNEHCSVINEISNTTNITITENTCKKCQSQWLNNEVPTKENPSPIILQIIDANSITFEKVVNYTKAVFTHVKSGMTEVPNEVYEQRLKICEECPNYIADANKCGLCGCQLGGSSGFTSKLKMPQQRCPDNPPRWDVYTIE